MVKSCVLVTSVAWYPQKQGYVLLGCLCCCPSPAFFPSQAGHPGRAITLPAWWVSVSRRAENSSILLCWISAGISPAPATRLWGQRLLHGVPRGWQCLHPALQLSHTAGWNPAWKLPSPLPLGTGMPFWDGYWEKSWPGPSAGARCAVQHQGWCRMQSPHVFLLFSCALCSPYTPVGKAGHFGVHIHGAELRGTSPPSCPGSVPCWGFEKQEAASAQILPCWSLVSD